MNFKEPSYPLELTMTTEFALAVKAICDEYNLSQERLARFGYVPPLLSMAAQERVKRIRQISLKVPIHPLYAPQSELNRAGIVVPMLDITWNPNPGMGDPREVGLYEFELRATDGKKIRFWRGRTLLEEGLFGAHYTLVEKSNLSSFYRTCIELDKIVVEVEPPILKRGTLEDVWANSIGFLQNSSANRELFKQYKIPVKRGIMLAGRPGCGKTMTCKWLRQSCIEQGLDFRVITMEEYRRAYGHGQVHNLFFLHSSGAKGIIFFDDMDIMFEDREKGNHHLTDFLTNLDGCDPREGVVFVFTSNKTDGLDGAFIRPGRIDLMVTFDAPNKDLRRRFILERFHPHVLEQIDVDDLVNRTELTSSQQDDNFPYTFAELEEVRKLLSIDDINAGKVDLHKTLRLFEKHRQEFNERITHFGFGKRMEEDEMELDDEDYYNFPVGLPIPAPGRPAR